MDADEDLETRLARSDELSERLALDPLQQPSALPYDPLRGGDAEFLLAMGCSPAEYVFGVMTGRHEYDRGKMEAAKVLIALFHAARPVKQQLEVTTDEGALALAKALRVGGATLEDVKRIRSQLYEAERSATALPH
jgi:hypothetical protein